MPIVVEHRASPFAQGFGTYLGAYMQTGRQRESEVNRFEAERAQNQANIIGQAVGQIGSAYFQGQTQRYLLDRKLKDQIALATLQAGFQNQAYQNRFDLETYGVPTKDINVFAQDTGLTPLEARETLRTQRAQFETRLEIQQQEQIRQADEARKARDEHIANLPPDVLPAFRNNQRAISEVLSSTGISEPERRQALGDLQKKQARILAENPYQPMTPWDQAVRSGNLIQAPNGQWLVRTNAGDIKPIEGLEPQDPGATTTQPSAPAQVPAGAARAKHVYAPDGHPIPGLYDLGNGNYATANSSGGLDIESVKPPFDATQLWQEAKEQLQSELPMIDGKAAIPSFDQTKQRFLELKQLFGAEAPEAAPGGRGYDPATEALNLIREIESQNRKATPDEIATLRRIHAGLAPPSSGTSRGGPPPAAEPPAPAASPPWAWYTNPIQTAADAMQRRRERRRRETDFYRHPPPTTAPSDAGWGWTSESLPLDSRPMDRR